MMKKSQFLNAILTGSLFGALFMRMADKYAADAGIAAGSFINEWLLPLAAMALTGILGLAVWYPIDRQQKRKAEQARS